jgi:hypothetical protein
MILLTETLLTPGRRSVPAATSRQATGPVSPSTQPDSLVSSGCEPPVPFAHRRDLCESREPAWIWPLMKC